MMNLKTTVSIFLIALTVQFSFADALPFKSNEHIEVEYENIDTLQLVKIGCIYEDDSVNDTIYDCEGSKCFYYDGFRFLKMTRFVPNSFKIIFHFKDRVLVSPVLYDNGNTSFHKLKVRQNGVENITPIFGTSLRNYFLAFFSTLFIELLMAFSYFKKNKMDLSNVKYVVLINSISHPILWLISANYIGFSAGNLFGEPVVLVLEALLLLKLISPKISRTKAFYLSLLMNSMSFIIGGILYLIFRN